MDNVAATKPSAILTPYELSIVVFYYAAHEDHEHFHGNPLEWRPAIDKLLHLGLIEQVHGATFYQLSDRGRVYVQEGLCRLPLPVEQKVWRMSF